MCTVLEVLQVILSIITFLMFFNILNEEKGSKRQTVIAPPSRSLLVVKMYTEESLHGLHYRHGFMYVAIMVIIVCY